MDSASWQTQATIELCLASVETIETENVKIIRSSRDAAMFIVSLGPMAVGGPLSPRRRISRSQAPRSVRNATEGAGGAGGGAKGASAAIEDGRLSGLAQKREDQRIGIRDDP